MYAPKDWVLQPQTLHRLYEAHLATDAARLQGRDRVQLSGAKAFRACTAEKAMMVASRKAMVGRPKRWSASYQKTQ